MTKKNTLVACKAGAFARARGDRRKKKFRNGSSRDRNRGRVSNFSPSHSSRCSRDKRVLSVVFFEVAHWALTKLPDTQAHATKTGDVTGDHLVKL